jgi:hypothetical protein
MAATLVVGSLLAVSASAQTQTAQSAMVALTPDSQAYEIAGTTTWTFNRGNQNDADLTGLAMSYYTNVWDGVVPTLTCTGGGSNGCVTPPAAPAAPAPKPNELQQQAQGDRCTFFFGGTLGATTYTQGVTVNVGGPGTPAAQKGNWTFTYTYAITPIQAVDPQTAWTSEVTGGSVNLGFGGFVASESYQKQSNRHKYSFTMVDGGITRARNVSASLMKDSATLASLDLNNVDTDLNGINDGLTVAGAVNDFFYFANGGIFGNSSVFSALHAPARKSENSVVNIVTGIDATPADNFAGNNNDLAAGNVHLGPYSGSFNGLTEPGDYTVVVAGTLKGNSSSADFGFSVTSSLIQIGGCSVK